ncbi:uncharacterized protein E0L32_006833 [Thyridium curvatum]|uniref:NAD-dependent epimerase/dehydratase domain-containing protein n=1 Tax=Thyridium curvatum TaxID=1093900 RepID=A0A507B5W9_9PEZI|nr:uncharacterized protein E0L32_006833 [Thyridium curvatum]TPX12421.1 hypothetical protein E0L32_006833 [Thyridium curvatum]
MEIPDWREVDGLSSDLAILDFKIFEMGSQIPSQGGKVLLTGGSGFIASHVLDTLLDHGFKVVVTVRSEEKGRKLLESLEGPLKQAVSFAVVPDIAVEHAFDQAIQSDPPFDFVVHTASPCHNNVQDPYRDMLDPAIRGTSGMLMSIKEYSPTVKRVVITSSAAAILNPPNHAKLYDETMWPDIDLNRPNPAPDMFYKASKVGQCQNFPNIAGRSLLARPQVLAERAAWDFVQNEKPNFDLVTINGTFTFGPVQRQLRSSAGINLSNRPIVDMVLGRMKDKIAPTAPVYTYVDVEDVALAHVRSLIVPEAGNNRFYIVGGHWSTKRVADIIRESHPELKEMLPPDDSADDLPDDVYQFDNTKSRKILGLEYKGLKESVVPTVESILRLQKLEASEAA